MSDFSVGPAGHGPVGPVGRLSVPNPVPHTNGALHNGVLSAPSTTNDRGGLATDRVELSDRAIWLDRINRLPEVRLERVEAARRAIADSALESDEALLDQALERMIDDAIEFEE